MMRLEGCVTSASFSHFSRSLNQLATERKRFLTEKLVRGSVIKNGSVGLFLFYDSGWFKNVNSNILWCMASIEKIFFFSFTNCRKIFKNFRRRTIHLLDT